MADKAHDKVSNESAADVGSPVVEALGIFDSYHHEANDRNLPYEVSRTVLDRCR
jgi:hypothetical protein